MKTKKISWQAIAIVVLALVLIASIALGVSGAWFQDRDSGNSTATLGHEVTVKLQDVKKGTGSENDVITDGVKGWANIYDSTKTNAYPGDPIIGKTRIQLASDSPALIRMSVVPEVWEKVDKTATGEGLVEVKSGDEVLYKLKKVDLSGEITLAAIGEVSAPTAITDATAVENYYNALIASKPVRSEMASDSAYNTALSAYKTNAGNWNKWLLRNMTTDLTLKAADWTQGNDGLMYYNKVAGKTNGPSTGATVEIDLFESASLNQYLTNEVAQWKVSIDLNVEAIQAAHANEEIHPWYEQLNKTELNTLKTAVDTYHTGRLPAATPGA